MTLKARELAYLDNGTSLTLLHSVRQEDPDAWATLHRLYSPLVRYWAMKFGVANADIDDVEQDVFRSIHSGIGRFSKTKGCGSFRAWIWTISRNKIRDYFKIRSGKATAAGGTEGNLLIQQLPDVEPGDDDTSFGTEGSLITRAINIIREQIEPQTFQAFWRSTVDGVAPGVVADELSISVDSVYQAKSRVLRRLRDMLD